MQRAISVLLVTVACVGCISAANASVSVPPPPSADITISVPGVYGNTFAAGQPWTLTVSSDIASDFSLCAIDNHSIESCTPIEDGYNELLSTGAWTKQGVFSSSTIGSWTEWASFTLGSQVYPAITSNRISFIVNPPEAGLGSSPAFGGTCSKSTANAILQAITPLTIVASMISTPALPPTVQESARTLLIALANLMVNLNKCIAGLS